MATSLFTQNPLDDRNQDATIYVGNLDEKVNEAILWELFLQSGPVCNLAIGSLFYKKILAAVHMPKDRVSGGHQGYGFVEFLSEEDADYALKIMNMIKLYGKPIRVNKATAQQKNLDVGANVFVGNLDPEIDEKMLYDIFSAFGVILQTPKIMRDVESGSSKGFAFVNYASFEASDAAIAAMNGQHLLNRAISVSYAFKKDSKGERHGSSAERLLATTNPFTVSDKPHQLFADAPPVAMNPDAPGGAVPLPHPNPPSMAGFPPKNPYFTPNMMPPFNPFAPTPMGHLNAPMLPTQPGILAPPANPNMMGTSVPMAPFGMPPFGVQPPTGMMPPQFPPMHPPPPQ